MEDNETEGRGGVEDNETEWRGGVEDNETEWRNGVEDNLTTDVDDGNGRVGGEYDSDRDVSREYWSEEESGDGSREEGEDRAAAARRVGRSAGKMAGSGTEG